MITLLINLQKINMSCNEAQIICYHLEHIAKTVNSGSYPTHLYPSAITKRNSPSTLFARVVLLTSSSIKHCITFF